MDKTLIKRIFMICVGVFIMGFAISLCVYANLGTDPCTCLNLGISSKIGLSYGIWLLIFNIIVLIVTFFVSRELIGIGTLINMTAVGFLVDFFNGILKLILPENPSIAVRFIVMLCGVVILAFTAALYMYPALGVSPYDSIAIMMSKFTHIKFHKCRIICDVLSVAVGYFCGSVVGIGTVLTAICTGPLIKFYTNVLKKVIPLDVENKTLDL